MLWLQGTCVHVHFTLLSCTQTMKYGVYPKIKGGKRTGASSFLICVAEKFLQCATNLVHTTLLLCLKTVGT